LNLKALNSPEVRFAEAIPLPSTEADFWDLTRPSRGSRIVVHWRSMPLVTYNTEGRSWEVPFSPTVLFSVLIGRVFAGGGFSMRHASAKSNINGVARIPPYVLIHRYCERVLLRPAG
jgi:hypothetical protein